MKWVTLVLLLFTGISKSTVAQNFGLSRLPVFVVAGMKQSTLPAYYDGEHFYFEIEALFELMGFHTTRRDSVFEALDRQKSFVFDMSYPPSALSPKADSLIDMDGKMFLLEELFLLSEDGMQSVFGNDMHFDARDLSLTISSAATLFTVETPIKTLLSSVPGPLVYPRDRRILGGGAATYHITWHSLQQRLSPIVHASISALWGTMQGTLSRYRTDVSAVWDFPLRSTITRVEAGYLSPVHRHLDRENALLPSPVPTIRVSNKPLSGQILQRHTTLHGQTSPLAIVEALVAGQVVSRVEADSEGRYTVIVPTFFGTTNVDIRISPLGSRTPIVEKKSFLVQETQVPPGVFRYDAYVSENPVINTEYGLTNTLSLHVTGSANPRDDNMGIRVPVGITLNQPSNTAITADYDAVTGFAGAQIRVWWQTAHINATWGNKPTFFRIGLGKRYRAVDASTYIIHREFGLGAVTTTSTSVRFVGLRRAIASASLITHRTSDRLADIRYFSSTHRITTGLRWGRQSLLLYSTVTALGDNDVFFRGMEANLFASHSRWDLGITGHYSRRSGWGGGVTLRFNTPFGSISSGGSKYSPTAPYQHNHSITGAVQLSEFGLRMSAQTFDRAAAYVRFFQDTNGNARFDRNEHIVQDVEAHVHTAGGRQRWRNGYLFDSLEPYREYQLTVPEHTIRNPKLAPAHGYSFSFLADPGSVKRIDVPIVRPSFVSGKVVTDIPPGRLRIDVIVNGKRTQTSAVYRDGGFSLLVHSPDAIVVLVDTLPDEELMRMSLPAQNEKLMFDLTDK